MGRSAGGISDRPIVISNARYADLIDQQLAEIGASAEAVLLEPEGRNTAAVAAMAALHVQSIDASGLALLLPSDHYIGEPDVFIQAVLDAAPVAASGLITTFGIKPSGPETGFGYIQRGEAISGHCARIAAFKEKPDLETAKTYIADPRFSWNAGIFLFPASRMLTELAAHAGDVLAPCKDAIAGARREGVRMFPDRNAFLRTTSISVDYAVMERTQHAAVYAPLDCAWNDIGTWAAVGEVSQRANALPPVMIGAERCDVHSDDAHLVALVGVEDLIVVVDGGHVMITRRDTSQDVGKIVAELKRRGAAEHL